MVTVFKNIFDKTPYYATVDKMLERIRTGASKQAISDIRSQLNKERADKLKQNLPCVLFSGKFENRLDSSLKSHSGYLVIDFDEIDDLRLRQTEIISNDFVYACWVSPRGNGLKALVRIADGSKHREHFSALRDIFTDIDKSGVNEARVCYESFDPEIYINPSVKPFKKLKKTEFIQSTETVNDSVFTKLVTWLVNKGDAFVTGERNLFIYKLASACCRFGLSQEETINHITREYSTDNTFTQSEAKRAIQSAYRSNKPNSARFEKDILVEITTRSEVKLEEWKDSDGKVKDVIYGENVKDLALNIYDNGYEKVLGIGCDIDKYFKLKKGELTCLTGIGNYGKSSFLKWFLLMRVIMYGEKFSFFSPEDNPPQEFYHDLVEILLGCDCTPRNQFRPSKDIYNSAYDWISKYIFFLYPKNINPSPEYIKEKFLELDITEGTSGNIIDPFNQMHNDYGKAGGRSDKYLETVLGDFSRFAQDNDKYQIIVAHPHKLMKQQDGNYPCPDVFDLADGAMWNNKMDNIIVYHRPFAQTVPDDPTCEFHSKKIRRQKIVGSKGFLILDLNRRVRRFTFSGRDYMMEAMKLKKIDFGVKQVQMFEAWKADEDTEPF